MLVGELLFVTEEKFVSMPSTDDLLYLFPMSLEFSDKYDASFSINESSSDMLEISDCIVDESAFKSCSKHIFNFMPSSDVDMALFKFGVVTTCDAIVSLNDESELHPV